MTAPIHDANPHAAALRVGRACRTSVDGRRSIRALEKWCERFALSEPEFQVLWRLRDVADGGLDQTTLAKQLAFSPAQVSATVEKMRARGWISQHAVEGDRRRRLWRLSAGGSDLLSTMLGASVELRLELPAFDPKAPTASPEREAA